MNKLITILALLFITNINAQLFKKIYDNVFKYSTVYVAGDMSNAYENTRKNYFVERPSDDNLYDIPKVIDVTEYYPFDYRVGIGVRRMARFDYEIKQNYIDGTENMIGLSAPTASVK